MKLFRIQVSLLLLLILLVSSGWSQMNEGRIAGVILDSLSRPMPGVNLRLLFGTDSISLKTIQSGEAGAFQFEGLQDGVYRLRVTAVGYRTIFLDSIVIGVERRSYTFDQLVMTLSSSAELNPVVIVVDRSLIQSKDGNISFLAGDSPLANGSNVADLMTQVPLVTKDPDGRMTVRGKEPKILIDDKPVELNMQQLQDLLESMPGSSIEKIEVMTNPPPQFSQETAVINIVTKKGRVGKSGRVSLSGGTRGEWSAAAQFSYKKDRFSFQLNAGFNQNRFAGDGYSYRQNLYNDSTNRFNTETDFLNLSDRPSWRATVDYEWNKKHALNLVLQYNDNRFTNQNNTYFSNINRFGDKWRYSLRQVRATGDNQSISPTLSYTWRPKPGETLRLIVQGNGSDNSNLRTFDQKFLFNDGTPTGQDSIQFQNNLTKVFGWSTRVNYDRMLVPKKTYLSAGFFYNQLLNWVDVDAQYLKSQTNQLLDMPLLSQDFLFRQDIQQYRVSIKQLFTERFSLLAGLVYEHTRIYFDLRKEGVERENQYGNWLPFATLNRSWNDRYNLTLSYKQTINRPRLGELNPTVDFSDPYNTRYGNPDLFASTAHNFDLVGGWNRSGKFFNLGFGHNILKRVFSQVRTLKEAGRTELTWENIGDRREWEASFWTGMTLFKKLKMNASASYTYNIYGDFDRKVRRFRNGASFTSTLGSSYTPSDRLSFTGQFNLNRFATPQGFARWNMSVSLGAQRKFFQKRMTVSFNAIDPFLDQQRFTYTYAPNFSLESFSRTRTRNFRLSVAWLIQPKPKANPSIKRPR